MTHSLLSVPSPTTPEAQAAMKKLRERLAVVSILSQSTDGTAQLQEISLSDYQSAISAAPQRLFNAASWSGFLARFSRKPLPFGATPTNSKPKIDCSEYLDGEFILAVLPTDPNGVLWNEKDIVAGEQFYFQPAGGHQLAQVASILPEAIRAAGTFRLQFLPGEDKAVKVLAALQTAYARIQALTLAGEGTAVA